MEFEFDKEIDAILRKARESEYAFAGNQMPHLDADEISAFAENALPERAKLAFTTHLADCARCRKILSNIISHNLEAETVPAFVVAEEKKSVPVAPWYRRLFAFPNLAYSLGALVLVFGGLIGFTLLQSFNQADISQMSNRASKSAPVSASNTNSSNMTNTMTTNSAMNANSASVYTANTTTNTTSNSAVSNSSVKQDALSKEKTQDVPKIEDGVVLGQTQEKSTTESEDKDVVTTRSLPNPAKKNERDEDNKTERSPVPREEQKPKLSSPSSGATTGEIMTVSGKTFNRRNNVWYDSAYNNQATTNITRGTNDYKKLDQDLRQTVERLGGVVVIVWKSKAYRIQ